MTVRELYDRLNERIPATLSEPWDNDGIMCSADDSIEVQRALVTLDVTEEIVDYAIENHVDLIVSHHPLIFHPLSSVTEGDHVARKVIKLVSHNIAVFSFHTRADKVEGGVNDCLAEELQLLDLRPFGEGGLGRLGEVDEPMTLEDFAFRLKGQLGVDSVLVSDAYNTVHTVAVVGGEGKDYVQAALDAGADTILSGRLGYHMMEDAAELGINMVEAGHYFTEYPVTAFFSSLLSSLDPRMLVEIRESNMLRSV